MMFNPQCIILARIVVNLIRACLFVSFFADCMKVATSYGLRWRSPLTLGLRASRFQQACSSTASRTYNHLEIEPKWQQYWEDESLFVSKRRQGHPKKYILDMFPYPSGSGLHVGHPEGYTATDILARYYRMNGYDVLHPMGWDAFGLPAEQHAINTGTHPAETTNININTFRRQLKSLGFSYDWTREISTTDESYFKWTQWIFLKLFKSGLAYQSEVSVNWCPALGTVLANEEVINGLSERGNHPVIRQPLRQWVLKITQYADRLEKDLEEIQWPEGTLSAQKQWIGKSEGAEINFLVDGMPGNVSVFTTRPDTLMGVTYIVLAPEHPLVSSLNSMEQKPFVDDYLKKVASKTDLERTSTGSDRGKTGVFIGRYAIHPISKQRIPIWIADYVLPNYGTGAVMAVPAHDERDFEFAKKFDLPLIEVVKSKQMESSLPFCEEGVIVNSGVLFDGLDSSDCKTAVIQQIESIGAGSRKTSYKLRDWVFSRQRYWGEPIPIYFPVELDDPEGNPIDGSPHRILYEQPIAVEESELPLKLPDMVNFQPGEDPQGCLARAKEWRYFQKNGHWYARETNTMPQWAGSCWYYLRFADPHNKLELISKEESSWLPVDIYVGGQEHAVLHLLYARFWHKVLYDIGVVDHKEPFIKLIHQGMILGSDGEKMSKSRGNVINPDDVVREHGADALRLYEMFMGPLEAVKPWQTSQLMGVVRFRDRIFSLVHRPSSDGFTDSLLEKQMHKTIKKISQDVEVLSFNTAISTLMIFVNSLINLANSNQPVPKEALKNLIILVSPFAPHLAEECWQLLGHSTSVSLAEWPKYDETLCIDSMANVVVQVNGKVRGKIDIRTDSEQNEVLEYALSQSGIKKHVGDAKISKVIYVSGKILNIVLCK